MTPFDPDRDKYFYRTKDFTSIATSDDTARIIVARNNSARFWLERHKADNLRHQFIDESGALVADDDVELAVLMDSIQREYLV